jgi:hypothetical protein
MDVTPTFYTKKGEAFVGEVFQMQAAEVKTVNLKSLMPASIRERHDWGGMTLSYAGHPLEMWGQLRLLHVRNGDSVDVVFANLSDKRSAVRNAVWLMPKHGAAVIAIGNAGSAATKAVLRFSNGDSNEVEVPSFGTKLIQRRSQQDGDDSQTGEFSSSRDKSINRQSEQADGGLQSAQAEAVTITSADGGGNLLFAGAVSSDEGSFTTSIRFYDTQNVAQQNLFATNFRLHNVKPRLLLRNTGTESIVATPRFRPVNGDANNYIDLAGVTLSPNEIANIDLAPWLRGHRAEPISPLLVSRS